MSSMQPPWFPPWGYGLRENEIYLWEIFNPYNDAYEYPGESRLDPLGGLLFYIAWEAILCAFRCLPGDLPDPPGLMTTAVDCSAALPFWNLVLNTIFLDLHLIYSWLEGSMSPSPQLLPPYASLPSLEVADREPHLHALNVSGCILWIVVAWSFRLGYGRWYRSDDPVLRPNAVKEWRIRLAALRLSCAGVGLHVAKLLHSLWCTRVYYAAFDTLREVHAEHLAHDVALQKHLGKYEYVLCRSGWWVLLVLVLVLLLLLSIEAPTRIIGGVPTQTPPTTSGLNNAKVSKAQHAEYALRRELSQFHYHSLSLLYAGETHNFATLASPFLSETDMNKREIKGITRPQGVDDIRNFTRNLRRLFDDIKTTNDESHKFQQDMQPHSALVLYKSTVEAAQWGHWWAGDLSSQNFWLNWLLRRAIVFLPELRALMLRLPNQGFDWNTALPGSELSNDLEDLRRRLVSASTWFLAASPAGSMTSASDEASSPGESVAGDVSSDATNETSTPEEHEDPQWDDDWFAPMD